MTMKESYFPTLIPAEMIEARGTKSLEARSKVANVPEQTMFLAYFVIGVGLIVTKGPEVVMMITNVLGSYLQLAVPFFQ